MSVAAPHSCEWGLEAYFWTGVAALLALVAVPFLPPFWLAVRSSGFRALTYAALVCGIWVSGLFTAGFKAVIYLAPFSVSDVVQDEPAILRGQGIAFAHLPIPFSEPTQAHFSTFTELMAGFKGKRILVRCQVNMRASCMVFLHRVIVGKEPAAAAYEAVSRVWSPRGAWLALLKQQLRKHQIDFEPF